MEGWMDEGIGEWIDGWVDGRMDGWVDEVKSDAVKTSIA